MALVREVNKTLIGVVKQLESMRSTYRSLHKYEMPVGNPIEKNIKNISCQLAKLSGIGIKEKGKILFYYTINPKKSQCRVQKFHSINYNDKKR